MNIIPLKPGDIVTVNSDLKVRVFPTIHRVPSQGYALYKVTAGCLLPEYSGLPGKDIGALRRSGVKVLSDETESLELVYTGDTVIEGLLQPCNSFIFTAAILIMELTYLDGDRQKAIDRGHIHLQDIVENADKFQNQQIVFVHLSERYGPHGKALMMLRDSLPPDILRRSVVSLRSFGSGEHLTKIAAVDWNKRRADVGWGWGRQVNSSSHGGGRSRSNVGNISNSNSQLQHFSGDISTSVHSRSLSTVTSGANVSFSHTDNRSSSYSESNTPSDMQEAVSRLHMSDNSTENRRSEFDHIPFDGDRDSREGLGSGGGRRGGFRGRGPGGPIWRGLAQSGGGRRNPRYHRG